MKKRIMTAVLAVTMVFLLAACGNEKQDAPEQSSTDSHYPVTVTTYDYAGREVETVYEKAPEKVIAVYQGSIETMIALGLEDRVIASYGLDNEVKDEWKEGLEKMNYQKEPFAPDKETVTAAQPDMILSWGSIFADDKLGNVSSWISGGVNTYINTNTRANGSRSLENEYTDILNLGKIFDVEDRAKALVNEMKAEVDSYLKAAESREKLKVAVVEPYDSSITNYGTETLAGSMVTSLGADMAIPEASSIGKEDLIGADPDVIFVVYMAYSGDSPEKVISDQLAVIQDDPSLSSLKAVKNNRVYAVMLGDMYASGPRTIDGIRTFAEGIYQEQSAK